MNDERNDRDLSWQDDGEREVPPSSDNAEEFGAEGETDGGYQGEFQGEYQGGYDAGYDSGAQEEPRPSWEIREELGTISALLSSIKEVLLAPEETFRRMPVSGGLGGPLLFTVILGTIGSIIGMGWQLLFNMIPMAAGGGRPNALTEYVTTTTIYIAMMIFSPLLSLIGAFVSAGIYHVCLMIMGGVEEGFEATFRVICYVSGAVALFQIVPICGGMIMLVWCIASGAIGLREAHRTTTGKAVMAMLLPLIVCCVCGAVFIAVALGIGVVGANM